MATTKSALLMKMSEAQASMAPPPFNRSSQNQRKMLMMNYEESEPSFLPKLSKSTTSPEMALLNVVNDKRAKASAASSSVKRRSGGDLIS